MFQRLKMEDLYIGKRICSRQVYGLHNFYIILNNLKKLEDAGDGLPDVEGDIVYVGRDKKNFDFEKYKDQDLFVKPRYYRSMVTHPEEEEAYERIFGNTNG